MKLFNVSRLIAISSKALLCLSAIVSAAACEKIYDNEGDCSIKYQVVFTQKQNVLGADAFAERVKSISLFVFQNGELVLSKTESGDELASGHYAMDLDVEPGTYDLIAWGGLSDGDAFELAGGKNPVTKQDLVCSLVRKYDGGKAYSQRELNDLYHGIANRVHFPRNYGKTTIPVEMDLMKNTNRVRVVLQHYNGKELNKDDFFFSITDNNGKMNYDNKVLSDETITYREHSKQEALVTTPGQKSRADIASITSVVAELDIPRLMTNHKPRLVVNRKDTDDPVLDLPLIDLLLNAKGSREPQDFLNRQDDYSLIFYLDDLYGWYKKGGIWVNSWYVVYQDREM